MNNDLLKYAGNRNQIFEVRQYTMTDGRANGTKAITVWNGAGLSFTLLPDRCLDIADVRFNGNSMAYITPSGIVNPAYYIPEGAGWLRSYPGGFLTTCGLQNIGGVDGTPDLTLHGRISNTPCENLRVEIARDGLSAIVSGKARECVIFGCRLTMYREYRFSYGEDKITFTDVIVNEGFEKVPVSILYHMNIGYPLVSEKASIVIPSKEIEARGELALQCIDEWDKITPPKKGYEEVCYYHKLHENRYGVDNPAISSSMRIAFESDGLLDRIVEWKMFGEGDYVLGLEAASCTLDGRKNAIADGSQKYIEPSQEYTNKFTITFDRI